MTTFKMKIEKIVGPGQQSFFEQKDRKFL